MVVKATTQGMDSLDTDTLPRDRRVGFGRSTAARGKRFRCASGIAPIRARSRRLIPERRTKVWVTARPAGQGGKPFGGFLKVATTRRRLAAYLHEIHDPAPGSRNSAGWAEQARRPLRPARRPEPSHGLVRHVRPLRSRCERSLPDLRRWAA